MYLMHLIVNNLLASIGENNFGSIKSMFEGYTLSFIVTQIILHNTMNMRLNPVKLVISCKVEKSIAFLNITCK